uniref:Glycosyltransferase n=1 Tax=viral metagenome TaxID=1070528 RepID=A0A6M3L4L7_9ZZZZ
MQMDLIVFLSGNNLNAYTPLFLETLYRNCDVSNLHIHVVEKGRIVSDLISTDRYGESFIEENYVGGVGENVHNYLLRKKETSPVPFTIYEQHDPRPFFFQAAPRVPLFNMIHDYSETLKWSMENCGTNRWAIFCHSDMFFLSDIITEFSNNLKDHMGMYGIWGHCLAINREAYYKVGVGFASISNFRAVRLPDSYKGWDYIIRHASDPRCLPDSKIIYGWDTFQLMELFMIANGWLCEVEDTHKLRYHVHHQASGHGYMNCQSAIDDIENKINSALAKYGIQRV